MLESWSKYYQRYDDWDESHSFNVKIKLEYEIDLKGLGYKKESIGDEYSSHEKPNENTIYSQRGLYRQSPDCILLSFDAPYDWSIDSDWEDKALELLGLKEEWVLDSIVEDRSIETT